VFNFILERKVFFLLLKNKKWLIQMLSSLALNFMLMLPLLIPYFERAKQLGFYPYEQVKQSLLTPLSYFFSWNGSLLWDKLNATCISYPAFWDHMVFAGALGTIGFLFFIFLSPFIFNKKSNLLTHKKSFQLLWITALLTLLFFIRFNQTSFYRILFYVPGYGSMRALQRIVNFELLFYAIGIAYLINLISVKNYIVSILLFVSILVFAVADNYVKPGFVHQRSKNDSQLRINALKLKMKNFSIQSIISYEPDSINSSASDYHLDAMLAAQSLNLITLNGYSATSPGGYGDYWIKPDSINRKIWLDRMKFDPAKIIVVR
jgi:hypothetical protein